MKYAVLAAALTAPFAATFFMPACSSAGSAPHWPSVHHEAKGAVGPYSAVVEAGDLVFVAGRVGATKAEFEEEAATAIGAVEVELRRAGLSLGDVVQATCYLTDMGLYERFNAVYAERMPKPWPARAVVAVSALPVEARVEISVIARKRAPR
jgi:2-iminobutanoate/2-iminopropanoate deaminase